MVCVAGRVGILTLIVALTVVETAATTVVVTVKETANVGAAAFPTTVVIPLPPTTYQDTASFRLRDLSTGANIPAQFEVLERDWVGDASILHVAAHFQATATARGTRRYEFGTDGGNPSPLQRVTVADGQPFAGYLQVDTGALRFTVRKSGGFNVLDTVWYDADADGYEDSDRIILPSANHGGRFVGCTGASVRTGGCSDEAQHDAELGDPTCIVEESGPMRAVIRCERPAQFNDLNRDGDVGDAGEYHRHGYAVRIFAYAGRSDVKIDYQLQNSAKGPSLWNNSNCQGGPGACGFSGPLYFRSMALEWNLALGGTVSVEASDPSGGGVETCTLGSGNCIGGLQLAHTLHDRYQIRNADDSGAWVNRTDDAYSDGWVDVTGMLGGAAAGVQVVVRNMWETWPNGIEIDAAGRLAVQLWPGWSSQWDYSAAGFYGVPSGKPVYWLDDMRHVYKEVALRFHGAEVGDRRTYARTFDRYPVPVLPTAHYGATRVTMDLGGYNPLSAAIGNGALLEANSTVDLDENNAGGYRMGWDRWYADSVARMEQPSATGGGPTGAHRFLASEDPADFWDHERRLISLLNDHPQWMADYTHAADWASIGLTQAPYAGEHWRAQPLSGAPCPASGCYPISGSEKVNAAMDDQHAWFYHGVDAYWFNPNPWLRDWIGFLGEFRRQRTRGVERTPDWAGRAIGHALKDTIAAYRVTGTVAYLTEAADYLQDRMSISPLCGQQTRSSYPGDPVYFGFQNRPLADMTVRLRGRDWPRWSRTFRYLSAQMFGNLLYGHLDYNNTLCDPMGGSRSGGSDSTGWHNPDSMISYYWQTGKIEFKLWANDYVAGEAGVSGTGLGVCSSDNLRVCNANADCSGASCINIGSGPYRSPAHGTNFLEQPDWRGGWAGRMYEYSETTPRADTTPPGAPTNIRVVVSGGMATISWAAPTGGPAYYYVVWCDKPISEAHTTDTTSYCNWWYANPAASASTSVQVGAGSVSPVYAAVFAFDAANNMSAMSAVASSADDPPPDDPPLSPQRLRIGANP